MFYLFFDIYPSIDHICDSVITNAMWNFDRPKHDNFVKIYHKYKFKHKYKYKYKYKLCQNLSQIQIQTQIQTLSKFLTNANSNTNPNFVKIYHKYKYKLFLLLSKMLLRNFPKTVHIFPPILTEPL